MNWPSAETSRLTVSRYRDHDQVDHRWGDRETITDPERLLGCHNVEQYGHGRDKNRCVTG